jgi:hypothetical protein
MFHLCFACSPITLVPRHGARKQAAALHYGMVPTPHE